MAFADRNISTARELAGQAESGTADRFGRCVSCRRVGARASACTARRRGQRGRRHPARHRHPAVDHGRHPGEHRSRQRAIEASEPKIAASRSLTAARDAAVQPLSTSARGTGSADPLGAFAKLTKADADLTRRLAALAEEQANAERLNRAFEQALFTAESRVRAVSEYIDTRRGSIGPEARTRLAEAKRQLQAAQEKRTTNLLEAICLRQRGFGAGPPTRNRWPMPTCSRPNAPTAAAEAEATTPAR